MFTYKIQLYISKQDCKLFQSKTLSFLFFFELFYFYASAILRDICETLTLNDLVTTCFHEKKNPEIRIFIRFCIIKSVYCFFVPFLNISVYKINISIHCVSQKGDKFLVSTFYGHFFFKFTSTNT